MNAFTYTHRFSARLFAFLAVFSLLMSLLPMQAFAVDEPTEPVVEQQMNIQVPPEIPKVDICHATANGGYSNGKQLVNQSSILGTNGHDSHSTGGYNNVGDIIPPFGDYAGKNWSEPFISIYNSGCKADPKVIVKKYVVGTTTVNASSFTYQVGTTTVINNTPKALPPKVYTVTETPKAGVSTMFTATFGDDCDAQGQITAEIGKTKTCKITNDYTDMCLNVRGQQLEVPKGYEKDGANCYEIDVCPNLPLAQSVVPEGYHKNNDGQCVPDENPQYSDVTLCKVDGEGEPLGGWELFIEKGDSGMKNGTTDQETGCLTLSDVPYGTYTVHETAQQFWKNVASDENYTTDGAEVSVNNETMTFTLKNKEVEHCTDDSALNFNEEGKCEYPDPGNEMLTACKYQVWEGEEGSAPLAGWEMTFSNNKEGEDLVTKTEVTGENGCVSVEVDPEDGPFYVTEDMPEDWTQDDVSATGGTVEDGVGGEYCKFFAPTILDRVLSLVSLDTIVVDPTYRCDFYNMEDEEEVPQCTNLLVNGSFEDPVVGGDWGIFNPVVGWVIDTLGSDSDGLELWANGFYGGASDGNQNAELDGNAPTKISQNVLTTPGATYELKFDFSARPDADSAADNSIDALIDGAAIMNATADGSDIGTNTWSTHSKTFVAASSTTNVAFEDKGTANSYGSLMDNARLCLVREPEPAEACSITMISDTTNTVDGNPAVATWVHPLWLQQLTGSAAQWIWGTQFVVDPSATTTETFTKTFMWNGPVTSAILDVAADNSYSVKVNGVTFGGDASGDNFSAADHHDMTAFMQAHIISGNNTLEITVTNSAYGTEDPQTNPAGLLYNLMLVGDTQTDCKKQPGGGDNGGNDGLTCQLTANDTSVKRGTDVTLNWSTTGASAASIDQSIGSVATTSGSTVVNELNDDTTFTMTVMDKNENKTTCSVSIDTTTGGGGGGGHRRNRDGDVEGDSDSRPEGQVLGDQVSVVPLGAADAGAGGTSPMVIPTAQLTAVALLGRTRK